jgi:hypothetical protein
VGGRKIGLERVKDQEKRRGQENHNVGQRQTQDRKGLRPDIFIYLLLLFSGFGAQCGLWPPHSRAFLMTHNDTSQSVGLFWMSALHV